MKQNSLIIALFMSLSLSSAHKLSNGNQVGVRFMMQNQVQQQGIFDKMIQKINKEQTEKEDTAAMIILNDQKKKDEELRQKNHDKNWMEAQEKAMKMIKDMQDEAKMDASLMLNESIQKSHEDKKAQEADIVEEDTGFIGKFIDKQGKSEAQIKSLKKKEEDDVKQETLSLEVQSRIDNEFAPKLGVTAVGEALEQLGEKFTREQGIKGLSEDEVKKSLLKANLALKLKAPETPKNTMAKFDKLPVKKTTVQAPDAIGDFLNAVNKQESDQREAIKKEETEQQNAQLDAKAQAVLAANKGHEQSTAQVEDFIPENPIAEMYVKQHPDVIQKAQQYDYSDDMQSHYSDQSANF